jgi:hypothetical protein
VLAAAGGAANDFVSLTGAKLLAGVVMVLLVVVLVASFVSKTPLLSRVRGVQPRQSFNLWISVGAVIVGYVAIKLLGKTVASGAADTVGLHNYPGTVAGVLYAALFTALLALSQWETTR